jgi:histidine ammonia-lyase
MKPENRATFLIGRHPLDVGSVIALADGRLHARLDPDPEYRARLVAGAEVVRRRIAQGDRLYGITTGFGDSCDTAVPAHLAEELPVNLMRFHGCGTGPILDDRLAAAVLAVRIASLARGVSGVRPELLERLCDLLNARLLPRIPAQGSVGASGDLTPLSYIAAAVVGEREVSYRGEIMSAASALDAAGIEPLCLEPKESLAIMNGTSVMTALGCVAHGRARRFARLAAAVTAMAVDVMRCSPLQFDPRSGEAKPHPGQIRAAAWIRDDIEFDVRRERSNGRVQDRYSIRCAPHVIGVLVDALDFSKRVLEIEVNGASDNPLVFPDRGEIVNGGNFYGGHVAFVLDGLKTAVANVASLIERQMALLCDARTSGGLPPDLVADSATRPVHHGFKAMQISASALCAEALKLTMPASVFSRSTECHNQDIVSMGTHAARDCLQIMDLCETVAAICVLATCQAADLRSLEGCHLRSRAVHAAVREHVARVGDDRRQDEDIAKVLDLHRSDLLPIGEFE